MDLRGRIGEATKDAMRARAGERLSVLRLMGSAVKDRDIAARGEGLPVPVPDDGVLAVLARMVKQRGESARAYEEAGRADLAARERAEVAVIEEFLPQQMTPAEIDFAADAIVGEIAATSVKDMGRVMALMKERHAGQMDMGAASAAVKARLTR